MLKKLVIVAALVMIVVVTYYQDKSYEPCCAETLTENINA